MTRQLACAYSADPRDSRFLRDARRRFRRDRMLSLWTAQEEPLAEGLARPGVTLTRRIALLIDTAIEAGAVVFTRSGKLEHPEFELGDHGLEVRCLGIHISRARARSLASARRAGARAGRHQGGPAPFGYRRDYTQGERGGRLIPEPSEAQVVRRMFRSYLRLGSLKRLIEALDDDGIRTRRGKTWSRAGLAWILKNETYLGKVHFGATRAKGIHPAIISPGVFKQVQQLIRKNNKRNGDPE